jgi:thiol-disulfide isomerase/thioredoxin
MKRKMITALSLILGACILGCGSAETETPGYGKATDFEIRDINGNTVKLADYSGKVIILNFFATWCPPCRREMPDFNEIAKKYPDDVKIIAVNVGREALPTVQSFASRNKLDITIALDDGSVGKAYGPISAIPVTVMIDRKFNIAKRYIGLRQQEVFVADIEKLL